MGCTFRYEAAAASKAGEGKQVEVSKAPSAPPPPPPESPQPLRAVKEQESDLDEYLMASGEEDEGEFDLEDFDHFVNSGVRRQGGWGLMHDRVER